jgi:23S rRNA (cytosine1962-C5)-methyltransferase
MATIHLKKGRDASLRRRHPWVFSGAISDVKGKPALGDTVKVFDNRGELLGVGAYSPHSQIQVRMWAFVDVEIDEDFIAQALKKAIDKRKPLLASAERNACRLVFGESDHLPGLVIDKFDTILVCQFLFAGVERWKQTIVKCLEEQTACLGIYERSDAAVREKEGLPQIAGVLAGQFPEGDLIIQEYAAQFAVDIVHGQKTGFYLDQAQNRQQVGKLCSEKRVLNCFAYTGGFSVSALLAGATEVISVDSSAPALNMAIANVQRNSISSNRHSTVEANVFHLLREWQTQADRFDVIVLDPPKFADTKNQVQKAARAYKDLALQAVKLLNPGGLLVNFSCSGGMDLNLFQKITADAFLDAGRGGEILHYLHQASDHPISLPFPESQYLKGIVSRLS